MDWRNVLDVFSAHDQRIPGLAITQCKEWEGGHVLLMLEPTIGASSDYRALSHGTLARCSFRDRPNQNHHEAPSGGLQLVTHDIFISTSMRSKF